MNPPVIVDHNNQPLPSRTRTWREAQKWSWKWLVAGSAVMLWLGSALQPFEKLYQFIHTPTPQLSLVASFVNDFDGLPCLNLILENRGDASAVISGGELRVLNRIPLEHVAVACVALPIDTPADCAFALGAQNATSHPISNLVREIKPGDVDRAAIVLKPTDAQGVTLAFTIQVSLTCNQQEPVAIPSWMLIGPDALRALANSTRIGDDFAAHAPQLIKDLTPPDNNYDLRLTEVIKGVKQLQPSLVKPL